MAAVSRDEFVRIYNDIAAYPTNAAVAAAIGCHIQKVKERARRLRASGFDLIDRKALRYGQSADTPKAVPAKYSPAPVSADRWVITSAVSDSEVHKPFLQAIQRYCADHGAVMRVVPIRYRNPTSQSERPADWFAPELLPYLTDERTQLCPMLRLMADVPTQPTAVRPLSGLQTMSGEDSAIYGHTKIAYESVPCRVGMHPKAVMTTGAITLPSYSESKAGKKGEFHHVIAAVIVEWDGLSWHARHIHANDDGSFFDLDRLHTVDGSMPASADVLCLGDLHGINADPVALDATLREIAPTLRPRNLVLHDVLDFESASHHHTFFDKVRLHAQGKLDVMQELQKTCAEIDRIAEASPWSVLHIVDSNHCRHFDRWLENANNATDPGNALVYHQTKAAMIEALVRDGQYINPFEYWARRLLKHIDRVRFVGHEQPLVIGGVDYSNHGDRGPNGARGSIASYTKVGIKTSIGHSHSAGIMDGVYQCGTSSKLDMGYNAGSPSSWSHTHIVQYPNGKRSLLTLIAGQWRLSAFAQTRKPALEATAC